MAVLPGIKGIQVRIDVGDKDAREYTCTDHNADRSTSVTKYIEAVEGATFTIRIIIIPMFKYKASDITANVEVDGQIVSRPLIKKDSLTGHHVTKIGGIAVKSATGWAMRRFVIEKLITGKII